MMTALVSALTGRAVRRDVAMTGEITLRSSVLAIGGLKEKSMAAYKAGVKTIIIPKANEKDLAEIDKEVMNAITFIPVKTGWQVLEHALTPDTRIQRKASETYVLGSLITSNHAVRAENATAE